MLVFILGVVFFLKYAFDRNWINLQGRILLGVIGGLAVAVTGDLLERKRRYGVYPQVLLAGGSIIVYFTLYATYIFRDFRAAFGMTLELNSILLGTVALLVAAYAAWRRTQTQAILAILMVDLTTLFAERWDEFSVFYLLTLTVALLAVAGWRQWHLTALVAIGGADATFIVYLYLGVDPVLVVWASAALAVLSLLLSAAVLQWEEVSLATTLGSSAVFSLAILATQIDSLACAVAAGVTGIAAVLGTWRRTWIPQAQFSLLACFGIQALGLLGNADPLGVILIASIMGLLFLLVPLFLAPEPGVDRSSIGLIAAASLLATWGVLEFAFHKQHLAGWPGGVTAGLAVLGLALIFFRLAAVEARIGWGTAGVLLALAWPPLQFDGIITTLVWTFFLLVAAVAYRRWSHPLLRYTLLLPASLIAAHLAWVEAVDLEGETLSPEIGVYPFLAASFALLFAWWILSRKEPNEDTTPRLLLLLGLAAPLAYVTLAMNGYVITILWAMEAAILVGAGFLFSLRDLRLAGLSLFALVLTRVFLVDIAKVDVAFRIVTFLVVGALLLVASFLYARRQRPFKAELASNSPQLPP